ncbi:hypothetical protein AB0B31_10810 [Catellatospora citrea]|uniref:hypothetical protein n=1 Tax=Catellatospora citrea TaxID=53366 RepID=UPI0033EF4077
MSPTVKPSRSLPEHTVDCWVAAEVLERLPDAQLWAPTQVGSDNWDTAFGLGPTKCFILEDKATEPRTPNSTEHKVTIDMHQLMRYIDTVGAPVYYVLPAPPWDAMSTMTTLDPVAPVPAASRCRTGRRCAHASDAHGPFATWTYVVDALPLLRFIADYRTSVGAEFSIRTCDFEKIPGVMTLQEFLRGVESCDAGGVPYTDAATARQGWQVQASRRRAQARDLWGGGLYERFGGESRLMKGRSGVLAVAAPVPGIVA